MEDIAVALWDFVISSVGFDDRVENFVDGREDIVIEIQDIAEEF